MSDATSSTSQPAVDPNITKMLETVEAGTKQLREKAMADFERSFKTELDARLKPDRTVVEKISEDKPTKREASRIVLTPAEDQRYRLLPESERKFRKPETDHWIAEWIRGMAQRDARGMQRLMIAEDKLGEIARADTLEGTTTATSGLSQGTGGALIPLPFSTLIVRARDKQAKLRARATKFTSDALTLRVPVSSVSTAAMSAEGAVAAQGEPTLTSKLFHKKKMQANFEASVEMLADSALNLVSFFSERAGSSFGALEDVQLCTSNGTAPNISQSLGSATITAVTEAVAGTVGYADVVKMYFALPQQYRSNAVWMAESTVLQLLSTIRTTGGMPIFAPQTGVGLPVVDDPGVVGTIFGRPVIDVPVLTTELFFGNLDYMGILEGGGIEAKTSDSALWAADSVAFRFTMRWDGLLLLEDAFRQMEGLTTAGT
jgi:HK97 family phage major capsid protein